MTLALVIPVRDDQRNLDRLLRQVRAMALFDQVIIIDDASDLPATVPGDSIGPRPCPVTLLRRETPGGAGAARNAGLPLVQTDHMIFFDSDDLFTPEFAALWHDLAGQEYDFCVMRYQDSNRDHFGGWGQNPYDNSCWERAGLGGEILTEVTGPALWALAEAGNFPWNKIYRTAFLRDNALRCTETRVHNDIELHWTGFLAATRILASCRIASIHVVQPGAGRLTNLTGEVRLQVFQSFDRVVSALKRGGDNIPATQAFLRFADGLLIWIEHMISPYLQDEFHRRKYAFLSNLLTPAIHETLIHDDPVLALRLCLRMAPAHDFGLVPC